MKKSPPQVLPLGLGMLACLILAWHGLCLNRLVPVDGNMVAVSYPNWKLARSLWLEPRPPLWNPWRNMGTPHLADPITSALYPPLWLFSAFGDFIDFLRSWVMWHTLLASCFAALLAWRWYKDSAAGAAAALTAGLNGFFMARVMFPHHFASQAWLPAILYFQDLGSPIGLASSLALQWFAGYPTFSILSALSAFGLAGLKGPEGLKCFLKGCAWALGLAAVQWIPFFEFLTQSSRGLMLDPNKASQYSIPPLQLLKELVLPQWYAFYPKIPGDPAMLTIYIGALGFLLAIWGVLRGTKREKYIGGFALACLVLSLGDNLPGFRFYSFLHFFRYPCNWLFPATAALTLLCAAGVSHLGKVLPKLGTWKWIAVLVLALDLVLFAQYPKAAWAKPEFLSDMPPLALSIKSMSAHCRIYHSEHLMRVWGQGKLENEEDYLLMKEFLAPSYGMAFGLEDIVNHQTLRLKRADQYRSRLTPGDRPELLDSAGACVRVSLREGAQRVQRRDLEIRWNKKAKPRVFLTQHSQPIGGGSTVRLIQYRPGLAEVVVDAKQPSTVVFSEAEYPGWRATLNGKKAELKPFQDMFLSVDVPSGTHTLLFRFSPLSFWLGLMVSLITFLALLGRCLHPHGAA